jgi:hypothetical protein
MTALLTQAGHGCGERMSLTHATERSYTDARRVRVAGAMDQRRLLSLSTTGPAKRVSPH